jgi:hypothetical protein
LEKLEAEVDINRAGKPLERIKTSAKESRSLWIEEA